MPHCHTNYNGNWWQCNTFYDVSSFECHHKKYNAANPDMFACKEAAASEYWSAEQYVEITGKTMYVIYMGAI